MVVNGQTILTAVAVAQQQKSRASKLRPRSPSKGRVAGAYTDLAPVREDFRRHQNFRRSTAQSGSGRAEIAEFQKIDGAKRLWPRRNSELWQHSEFRLRHRTDVAPQDCNFGLLI
jgi:hypothetical protein